MAYEANKPISLRRTTIRLEVNGKHIELPATAILRLLPSPRLVIECAEGLSAELIELDVTQSQVTASLFDTTQELVMRQTVLTSGGKSNVGLTLLPKLEPVSIQLSDNSMSNLSFGVLNFPKFFLGQDKQILDGTHWKRLGSVLLQADGWDIEITAVSTLSDTEVKLKEEGGYAITHTGMVKRSDGCEFTVKDVEGLLSALRLFLSFSRGAFCGLTLVVGKDGSGESVWEQWGTHRVTEWSSASPSWFDRMNGYILSDAFPGFWMLWQRDHKLLHMVVDLYLNANLGSHGVGYDGGLILSQAALERFSYHNNEYNTGSRIAKTLKNLGVSENALRISQENCPELAELGRQYDWEHGPHALVELRNNIVHPNDKYQNLKRRAYYEAWNLAQWYTELILLRLSGYEGNYGNRLSQEWVGEVESLGRWLVENVPRGVLLEVQDRSSNRKIPFVDDEEE